MGRTWSTQRPQGEYQPSRVLLQVDPHPLQRSCLCSVLPLGVGCIVQGVLHTVPHCACSAGKSLVAEVLLIRRVIDTGKKAFLVLPFVSICYEKVKLGSAPGRPCSCI